MRAYRLTIFSFPESITQPGRLIENLRSMAVYGEYPEVVAKITPAEKQAKICDNVESALFKDIFMLERIKAPQVLARLLTLLAYMIGNLINLNEQVNQNGISRITVDQCINFQQ